MRVLMFSGMRAKRAIAVAFACACFFLAGCSTSGRTFQSSELWQVVPGQTTVEQASEILGSEPVATYRRMDGSLVARWAHSASLVTDAVYFRQELWLAFGSDGKFQRIVKKVNIPIGAHPGVPLPSATASTQPTATASTQPSAPRTVASRPAQTWTQPLDDTAITYPLND